MELFKTTSHLRLPCDHGKPYVIPTLVCIFPDGIELSKQRIIVAFRSIIIAAFITAIGRAVYFRVITTTVSDKDLKLLQAASRCSVSSNSVIVQQNHGYMKQRSESDG
jgi:hypothetical protein